LINAPGTTRTRGAEVLLRYRWDNFTVTGSYVHVDATEQDSLGVGRRIVALTPHHTAGVVAMWEAPGKGRLGFEAYYTGGQRLENILNVRQTKYDSLLLPRQSADGAWTVDA